MINPGLEFFEEPWQVFLPDMVIDFPNEPPQPHPGVFNVVRDTIVPERVIDDLVAIPEELGDIFISHPGIGADQARSVHVPEEEPIQRAGFPVWNGPEGHLARVPLNRSNDDLLVVMTLLPDERFIHLNCSAKQDALLGQETLKPAIPALDGDVGQAGDGTGIFETEFLEPAVQQCPELRVWELGMGKRGAPFQGKLVPAGFTEVSARYLP